MPKNIEIIQPQQIVETKDTLTTQQVWEERIDQEMKRVEKLLLETLTDSEKVAYIKFNQLLTEQQTTFNQTDLNSYNQDWVNTLRPINALALANLVQRKQKEVATKGELRSFLKQLDGWLIERSKVSEVKPIVKEVLLKQISSSSIIQHWKKKCESIEKYKNCVFLANGKNEFIKVAREGKYQSIVALLCLENGLWGVYHYYKDYETNNWITSSSYRTSQNRTTRN